MNAGMTVRDPMGGREALVEIRTYAGLVELGVWNANGLACLSPSEARELAGALRRAADELDPIPEGTPYDRTRA